MCISYPPSPHHFYAFFTNHAYLNFNNNSFTTIRPLFFRREMWFFFFLLNVRNGQQFNSQFWQFLFINFIPLNTNGCHLHHDIEHWILNKIFVKILRYIHSYWRGRCTRDLFHKVRLQKCINCIFTYYNFANCPIAVLVWLL